MMRETDALDDYLSEERNHPFEWSSRRNGDCQLFPAGWVERIGWPGAGLPWRNRYSNENEARILLGERGGAVSAWCDLLGPPRMGSAARRGDVGQMAVDGWHLGMICTGSMWVIRAGEGGIRFVRPRTEIIVWDVGFS